ncbi:HAMP domain-containing histidine kinase [Photobacterium sp. BZF1]|uniref:sensor histidine kinase n=1 Tax=Photobacterium sp. BZF1 TaxID=1904457 RepID=UPI001653E430|nr:HAMP domain-containing sensor histidine kinase [Photobacterium sp. BZF1]MBC7005962.1 HAMP domain-containing histidine kinase [Photobacterium sp. BZF1]
MSLNMRAEQSTRLAQKMLFGRFVATVTLCFVAILLGIGLMQVYSLDGADKKLLKSMGAEYQRILKYESDDKLIHVLEGNPERLIENAITAVTVSQSTQGKPQYIAGTKQDNIDIPFEYFQADNRAWYQLLLEPHYLTLKLNGQQQDFWLALNVHPRLHLLFMQWLIMVGALALLCALISLFVWRLLATTLSPVHRLAKTLDQASEWSISTPQEDETHTATVREKLTAQDKSCKGESGLAVLNQSLELVHGRLEATITSMDNTLDAIAHDLRTPLSRIALTTENTLGSSQPPSNEQLTNALSDCAESAQQVSGMLNTLMKINDEAASKSSVAFEAVDLNQLMLDVASWYEELAEDRAMNIDVSGLKPCKVSTEPNRLVQVVVNLIDNSFKYTPTGGTIYLTCGPRREGAMLSVGDNGIGIAPEHHALIFKRLYRVDQSRTKSGYGLGLAMVMAMVTSLKARIRVDSVLGQGALFTVVLPGETTMIDG